MKCPICGKEVKNPNLTSHVRSIGHQVALRIQEVQQDLPVARFIPAQPAAKVTESIEYQNLKGRIQNLEKQFENLKGILILLVDELVKEGVLTEIIVSRFLGKTPKW